MKLSIDLTLDGIVSALRWQAHMLADEREAGYRQPGAPATRPLSGRAPAGDEEARGDDDDRSGR